LHGAIVNSSGVGKHGQRISLQCGPRENVHYSVTVLSHANFV
jgi:hypothetical protein